MESELISGIAFQVSYGLIPVAHIVPLILVKVGRHPVKGVSAVAWVLALLACFAFMISHTFMPVKYNIRVDLVIMPPLLIELLNIANNLSAEK